MTILWLIILLSLEAVIYTAYVFSLESKVWRNVLEGMKKLDSNYCAVKLSLNIVRILVFESQSLKKYKRFFHTSTWWRDAFCKIGNYFWWICFKQFLSFCKITEFVK